VPDSRRNFPRIVPEDESVVGHQSVGARSPGEPAPRYPLQRSEHAQEARCHRTSRLRHKSVQINSGRQQAFVSLRQPSLIQSGPMPQVSWSQRLGLNVPACRASRRPTVGDPSSRTRHKLIFLFGRCLDPQGCHSSHAIARNSSGQILRNGGSDTYFLGAVGTWSRLACPAAAGLYAARSNKRASAVQREASAGFRDPEPGRG
jgi:hypothetical protein